MNPLLRSLDAAAQGGVHRRISFEREAISDDGPSLQGGGGKAPPELPDRWHHAAIHQRAAETRILPAGIPHRPLSMQRVGHHEHPFCLAKPVVETPQNRCPYWGIIPPSTARMVTLEGAMATC